MSEENKSGVLNRLAGLLHVSVETFITIVSVIFVTAFDCVFLKHMFLANGAKDIYMNWDSITYVSDYYDEKKEEQCVSVTIEPTRGFPQSITVTKNELMGSDMCPIIMSSSVTCPQMVDNTLILPYHFDSVYGFVREYNKLLQEE